MKKKYLKPTVEYISLAAEDIITNGYLGENMSVVGGDYEDWE